MNIGIWQLVILALVVLVLFGRGRISEMMGDFGKGIKSFKQGMNEEIDRPAPPRIEQQTPVPPATVPPAMAPTAAVPPAQQAQQGAGQPMSYDPVSAPPSTDPHPPHPHVGGMPASSAPQQQAMPYDPVTAPATVGDAGQRG